MRQRRILRLASRFRTLPPAPKLTWARNLRLLSRTDSARQVLDGVEVAVSEGPDSSMAYLPNGKNQTGCGWAFGLTNVRSRLGRSSFHA